MQLHVTRIERDDTAIAKLEDEAETFLQEVLDICNALKERYQLPEAA